MGSIDPSQNLPPPPSYEAAMAEKAAEAGKGPEAAGGGLRSGKGSVISHAEANRMMTQTPESKRGKHAKRFGNVLKALGNVLSVPTLGVGYLLTILGTAIKDKVDLMRANDDFKPRS